jgi:hypothetical protein
MLFGGAKMINIVFKQAIKVAEISEGRYSIVIAAFIFLWIAINFLIAMLEILIFGHRFENFFDYIIIFTLSTYLVFCLYVCHLYNKNKEQDNE